MRQRRYAAQHRAAERAGQHADAEREGARHRGQDLAREAFGVRDAASSRVLRGSIGAPRPRRVRLLGTVQDTPVRRDVATRSALACHDHATVVRRISAASSAIDADARAVYCEAAGIARIDAARRRRSGRRRRRRRARALGGARRRAAHSARIGQQHGGRRDRRRRHRRPEPPARAMDAVDVSARTIRVRARRAARRGRRRRARSVGLRFPVDPSSGAFCTVGGMASTNAAGAHSLRYGSMRRVGRALDCVFADGSRAEVRRGAPAPRRRADPSAFVAEAPTRSSRRSAARRRGTPACGRIRRATDSRRTRSRASSSICSSAARGRSRSSSGSSCDSRRVRPRTAACSAPSRRSSARWSAPDGARDAGAVACELLDRTFLDVARRGGARGAGAGGRGGRAARRGRRRRHGGVRRRMARTLEAELPRRRARRR